MSDLKKKFLDMLFEPEDETVEEGPIKDIDSNPKQKKNVSNKNIPNAKDVLYGKQNVNNSFRDIKNLVSSEDNKHKEDDVKFSYELKQNISPIFGNILDQDYSKRSISEIEKQKATYSGSNEQYSGVIISPIFGYDSGKANSARGSLDSKPTFDDMSSDYRKQYDYRSEPAFEMPEESNQEAVQEAIQEAVSELSTREYSFPKDLGNDFGNTTDYEDITNRLNDLTKNDSELSSKIEEIQSIQDELRNEEEKNTEEEEEITPIEDYPDEIYEDDYSDQPSESEYYEPQEKTHSELVDSFAKLLDLDDDTTTTHDVSLFDYSDLNEDSDEKDFFDEIAKEDK